jgi:hypothetical protein
MLAAVVTAAEETAQEQVVLAAMAAFHLEVVEGVVEELQQAAQVAGVRQVKLEFGVGNDINQYRTITYPCTWRNSFN